MKQFVIDQMKEYQHRRTTIKAVKYQEGMEDAWCVGHRVLYGDRIFISKEEAIINMVNNRYSVIFPVLINEISKDYYEKIKPPHTVEHCGKYYKFTEIKEGMWLYIDENGYKNVLPEGEFFEKYELNGTKYVHIGYDRECESLYVENNCFRVYIDETEVATVEKLLDGFEISFTEKIGQVL